MMRGVPKPTPGWAVNAQCLIEGVPVDWFYPGPGRGLDEAGKAVCNRCPVRVDCLAHGMDRPEQFGTWGGESERGRDRLKRRIRRGTLTWEQIEAGQLWPDWQPEGRDPGSS